MKSWYKSFAELSAVEKEGLAFRVRIKKRGTAWAVIAPHGGGIEAGTSEIANAISSKGLSLYTFDGIRQSGNELLHITSTLFDEPRGVALVQSSEYILAIHGCEGWESQVYVGGLEVAVGDQLIATLQSSGFSSVRATTQFHGTQPENICNRGRLGRGVQLEISEGLRRSLFKSLDRNGRKEPRPAFRTFVNAIAEVIPVEASLLDRFGGILQNIF